MDPHLIDGFKYDLRLYVLVTSYDPLRIFLYNEGLVRFATIKYSKDPEHLSEKLIHLTNFSLNKNNENYVYNKEAEEDGVGSKWSLSALKRKFEIMKLDYDEMMDNVKDLIIKTLIAIQPHILDKLKK
jgi:tubulin polyglutamylase TTLL4